MRYGEIYSIKIQRLEVPCIKINIIRRVSPLSQKFRRATSRKKGRDPCPPPVRLE